HGDRTTVTFYANYISSEVSALYNEMIDTYNQTQGAEDNVWVNKYVSTGEISTSNLISMFNQRQCNYNIVAVSNMQFKSLMVSLPDSLVTLDDYLDDTAKETLDYDQIPETSINMYNAEIKAWADAAGLKRLKTARAIPCTRCSITVSP
ncbi:MAG TPA: hypothetical protein H9812_01530, partial [Candidatus Gallimonas intestinigallinarum]|nr:hypothetical protein [Candidatus Gallimonas intestinigallinarum]